MKRKEFTTENTENTEIFSMHDSVPSVFSVVQYFSGTRRPFGVAS